MYNVNIELQHKYDEDENGVKHEESESYMISQVLQLLFVLFLFLQNTNRLHFSTCK